MPEQTLVEAICRFYEDGRCPRLHGMNVEDKYDRIEGYCKGGEKQQEKCSEYQKRIGGKK